MVWRQLVLLKQTVERVHKGILEFNKDGYDRGLFDEHRRVMRDLLRFPVSTKRMSTRSEGSSQFIRVPLVKKRKKSASSSSPPVRVSKIDVEGSGSSMNQMRTRNPIKATRAT